MASNLHFGGPLAPGGRLKYGERPVNGRVVPCPREQKILALMRSLVGEGRTPYGVAKYLNIQSPGGAKDVSKIVNKKGFKPNKF